MKILASGALQDKQAENGMNHSTPMPSGDRHSVSAQLGTPMTPESPLLEALAAARDAQRSAQRSAAKQKKAASPALDAETGASELLNLFESFSLPSSVSGRTRSGSGCDSNSARTASDSEASPRTPSELRSSKGRQPSPVCARRQVIPFLTCVFGLGFGSGA